MQALAEKRDILSQSESYSLASFLSLHEKEKSTFHDNFLFQLMRNGELSTERRRDIFFEYYQEWSSQFQRMIFLRSALCEDVRFQEVFTQHFNEEYGHDKILQKERNVLNLKKDPVIQALCAWFPHKMLSSTPAEQLIISNLCIESAAVIIHTYAIPAFDPNRTSEYYKIHEEHDCHHEKMGLNLLKNLSEHEYKRCTAVLKETWNVLNALMARIGVLCLSDEMHQNQRPVSAFAKKDWSFEYLLFCNAEHKRAFQHNPLFILSKSDFFSSKENRENFLGFFQIWSNHFQKMMLLKTALCENPAFLPLFNEHFEEERGHDRLLFDERESKKEFRDCVLNALGSWFVSQMFILSSHEQIVLVHLCLEASSTVFHKHIIPAIDPSQKSKYLQLHNDLDSAHESMGYDLLQGLSVEQYERLLEIQNVGWLMINALMTRLHEIIIQS